MNSKLATEDIQDLVLTISAYYEELPEALQTSESVCQFRANLAKYKDKEELSSDDAETFAQSVWDYIEFVSLLLWLSRF